MNRKQVAAVTVSAWLILVATFMLLARRFDLEIFFVLALIGVLAIAELVRLRYVRPAYQRYLGYLIWAGIVIFVAIAVTKVMEIVAA
ncbi:MAG TPA: hypothetical protein PLO06_09770 [Methanoregulaceae archaeon]|nr:hypothetical protein [Methanoregulaceae archaeon]HPD76242.1 hypothetical protein [Methanoregulaceae archaeon]